MVLISMQIYLHRTIFLEQRPLVRLQFSCDGLELGKVVEAPEIIFRQLRNGGWCLLPIVPSSCACLSVEDSIFRIYMVRLWFFNDRHSAGR